MCATDGSSVCANRAHASTNGSLRRIYHMPVRSCPSGGVSTHEKLRWPEQLGFYLMRRDESDHDDVPDRTCLSELTSRAQALTAAAAPDL